MKSRKGFTLVELVIVVLILGILAAVAVPRLFNTSASAIDNGVKQTLSVVRDAIELYAADNARLPGQSSSSGGITTPGDLKLDLKTYIRGPFPKCPIGGASAPADVKYSNGTTTVGETTPSKGWHFNTATGDFIINYDQPSATDANVRYDEF